MAVGPATSADWDAPVLPLGLNEWLHSYGLHLVL